MPDWFTKFIQEGAKQSPSAVIFAVGLYIIAAKIDILNTSVVRVMEEQKKAVQDAMSVLGETKEVIRNNTIILSESANARRELAASIDRQKDFMLWLVKETKDNAE